MPVDLNKIAALMRNEFQQPFIDAMVRDNYMITRFGRKSFEGAELFKKIHYAGNQSAGPYSENDYIPEAGFQAYADARWPMKQNWVVVEVTGMAQAASRGTGAYLQVLANETKEALEDLKDRINDQMMASTADVNGRAIHGIGYIVSDKGVYAGINRTTNSFWASKVYDNATVGRNLTVSLLQKAMVDMASPLRRAKTDLMLTNMTHWYDLGNSLLTYRQQVNTSTVDGGYSAVNFQGMNVVSVPSLPTGVLYGLESKQWGYYVLEDFETKPKSTNKDSDRFIVTTYSNLLCLHPGHQFKIVDLTTSAVTGW
jgi:hypothetical protein